MALRITLLGTFPPTRCGIATFTESLIAPMAATGAHVDVVQVVEQRQTMSAPVLEQWVKGSPASLRMNSTSIASTTSWLLPFLMADSRAASWPSNSIFCISNAERLV